MRWGMALRERRTSIPACYSAQSTARAACQRSGRSSHAHRRISMSYEHILFERDGAVATITINREKVRNALNVATRAELFAALHEVEADDGLRVVIITGAGDKAFVAGADINELRALLSATLARQD